MLKIELIVQDLFEELRVDKYIAANYDEVSRSELKYYFDEEKILVNGKLAKPSLKVINGDMPVEYNTLEKAYKCRKQPLEKAVYKIRRHSERPLKNARRTR